MVTGDVKMGHNTSGTWPLRIFPAHSRMVRAYGCCPWYKSWLKGRGAVRLVKLLRLLWLIEMSNLCSPQRDTQPKDAGNFRKGWILHFLSSHTLSVKACSLSLPDQLSLWPEAKQNLNFPAWKENLCLPVLLGHIIPVLTAKPIPHLDICEKDLTQSGCSLIWKIFQSGTPFLKYMGYSKISWENISSSPASELGQL